MDCVLHWCMHVMPAPPAFGVTVNPVHALHPERHVFLLFVLVLSRGQ